MTERIHKVIANSGLTSRRAAEDLIRSGRVVIDGAPAVIGQRVDRTVNRIEVDGVVLPVAPGLEHHLVNKPRGVVSTAADTHGRPIVVDLVESDARLWPVGRLDIDSEGLIIVTNDGTLTHRLTHPRFQVEKIYMVVVAGDVAPETIKLLASGVDLDDGPAVPLSVRTIGNSRGRSMIEFVMTEGRNREIRRMCEAVGHDVRRLARMSIGGIRDPGLRPGTSRALTIDEVRHLYGAAGGSWQDDDPQPGAQPNE